MNGLKISVAIMAHPDRSFNAERLMRALHNQGFYTVSLCYDNGEGEWGNGVRSLKAHTDSDYHCVIQDDAILSEYFYDNVVKAINNLPTKGLISFYTGTVRPKAEKVQAALFNAKSISASWLEGPTLYWGVGLCIHTDDIDLMLKYVKNIELPYDRRIGQYYQVRHIPVYYTIPSLVDHDYRLGSLMQNDYASEPRKARNYHSGEVYHWNNKSVKIV